MKCYHLILIFFLLLPLTLRAQFMGYAQLGLGVPTGELNQSTKLGIGGEVGTKHFFTSRLAVGAHVGFYQFMAEDTLSVRVFPFQLQGEYHLKQGAFRPVVGSDLGLYRVVRRSEALDLTLRDAENAFGLSPFLGFVYQFSADWGINAYLKYHLIFSEESNNNFFNLNLGIQYQITR